MVVLAEYTTLRSRKGAVAYDSTWQEKPDGEITVNFSPEAMSERMDL